MNITYPDRKRANSADAIERRRLRALLRRKLAGAAASIWHALEAYGRARATREMARLAGDLQLVRPDLARELRAAHHFLAAD